MISAKIILDSVTADGLRLTTMEVCMPRMILAEMNTHRAFSRNSASSRAVPVATMLKKVKENPFIPIEFGVNQKGMQASEILQGEALEEATQCWLRARDTAVARAEWLIGLNVHKQIANRLLEPFLYHTAIISSTEWYNFFDQRLSKHGMAQPEMGATADAMYEALNASNPKLRQYGQWHTPYIQPDEWGLPVDKRMKLSVARCARVSYLTHDGIRSLEADYELFDRLVSGKHFSPFEHVAEASPKYCGSGNFKGWKQLRLGLETGRMDRDFLDAVHSGV